MEFSPSSPTPDATLADARVVAVTRLTARVSEIAVAFADGRALPPFEAGAHVRCDVSLPGAAPETRAYSLVNAPDDRDVLRMAVLRDDNGRGGSRFMHNLAVGASLRVSAPRNAFPLVAGAAEHVLLAGGIGVTPILAMARALAARRGYFAVHYVGRDRTNMAYADEIGNMANARVISDGGDPARGIDLAATLGPWSAGRHVYVCGPQGLITAARERARLAGWPEDHVHFEQFAADGPRLGDKPFDVVLQQSGVRLTVGLDESILDAMISAGLDPLFDCRRGECGICTVPVIAGLADHRDTNLSQRQRQANTAICTCVSRALGPLLVLDA